MSNSLDPIRPRQNVGPDLDPNCSQRLSADDMSGKVLMQKVKYNGFNLKLSDPKGSEVTNNLDPGQATMGVFPYRDTQVTFPRWGVQVRSFF